MPLGRFALENILGAAVRANRFATLQYVEKNARMQTSQISARLRAMQWQVVGGHFNGHLVRHFDLPDVF
jgi:hypothetical protein